MTASEVTMQLSTNEISTSKFTAKDKDHLLRLLRARKKTAYAAATEQSARLKASFEQKLAAIYAPHDSDAWKKANDMAEAAVAEANRQVAAECNRLGILPRFAPQIYAHWYGRGENAAASRRAELRKVADSIITRLEKTVRTKIEREALRTETEILSGSLSEAAHAFLEQLPSVDELMPELEIEHVEALIGGRGPDRSLDY
jgi:hypothetical protein